MKLGAIALNTVREYLRDKILYTILAFALLLIAASLAIGQLSIAERSRITIDLSLSCISIIGVLMAIFLGISLVSREIEKKTIYTLIAKPIPRSWFLLGRYLGLMLTIALNVSVMSLAFALTLNSIAGWEVRTFDWPIIQAIILIYLELGIVTAVAMVFSAFSSPILSAIFTIGFFFAGRFTAGVSELIAKDNPVLHKAARVMEVIVPNLTNYIPIESALTGTGLPPGLFFRTILVGVITIVFLLTLATLIFQRRDFV